MKRGVLALRPTQLALGLYEVDQKISEFEGLSKGGLKDYLKEHPVPVVIGPGEAEFLTDHHHLVRACWEIGVEKVHVDVTKDLSKLKWDKFWATLEKDSLCHFYDQFGTGPHPAVNLPKDVRGLADDPFRSLAWLLRERGAYQKSEEPFAEFQWANFLRKSLKTHPIVDNFDLATEEAMSLAKSPKAKGLPGYISTP